MTNMISMSSRSAVSQLDDMLSFKADISILLNITPDHLDRYHHDMGLYIISKFRILQNQGPEDKFIYFEDDPVIKAHLEKSSVIPFRVPVSLARHVNPGAYLNHESLHFLENPAMTDDTRLGLEELPLRGPHNYVNQMCAVLAARYAGVEWEQIRAPLRNFINFPHRMEKVGLINGVTWINDSKATNVDSVRYALDSYEEPIIWIAGGTDKGNDYEVLRSRVRAKVKTIVCLGKDNSRILGSFKNDVSTILDTHRVEDAVHEAFRQAKPGDVVLLSPACASFDLFKNYIDRGDRFRQAVKDLAVKNEIKN